MGTTIASNCSRSPNGYFSPTTALRGQTEIDFSTLADADWICSRNGIQILVYDIVR
jgi:hypothetical protein